MTKTEGHRLLSFVPNILLPKNQTENIETPRIDLAARETPIKCQENSRLAQIPEDILFLIVDDLDEKAQARLVRTCRHFHHLLEVSLYRHITPRFSWSYHRSDRLFRTLLERQDLLPYITTYNGPLLPPVLTPPQKQRFLDRFKKWQKQSSTHPGTPQINETEGFKRAVAIFTQATNIVDLSVTDCYVWASDPLFGPISQAVSKMSLKRLSLWQCHGQLHHLFRDQLELEELRLGWSCRGLENLEKTDVPKLRSLSASLQQAAHLVPGRPIERLDLKTSFGLPDFDLQAFDSLSLSTRPITYFSVSLYNSRDDEGVRTAIQAFARNWPDIESLVLTVSGPISGQIILDEIPSFQSIRELAFLNARLAAAEDLALGDPSRDSGIVRQNFLEDWDQLFSHLKGLCPTLVKTHTSSV